MLHWQSAGVAQSFAHLPLLVSISTAHCGHFLFFVKLLVMQATLFMLSTFLSAPSVSCNTNVLDLCSHFETEKID